MLKEAEIRTFIDGTTNYFEISAQQSATVGSPYLVTDGKPGRLRVHRRHRHYRQPARASFISPRRAACSRCC